MTNLRPFDAFQPGVSGMAWFPNGDLAVLTWGAAVTSAAGKLYRVENVTGQVDPSKVKYREIASGLDEPQGVQVVDGEIYVVEQNGLYRLADRNGDGFYEDRAAIASFLFSGNWHEFAFGLLYREEEVSPGQREGFFYVALSVGLVEGGALSSVPQHAANRGTFLKINKMRRHPARATGASTTERCRRSRSGAWSRPTGSPAKRIARSTAKAARASCGTRRSSRTTP